MIPQNACRSTRNPVTPVTGIGQIRKCCSGLRRSFRDTAFDARFPAARRLRTRNSRWRRRRSWPAHGRSRGPSRFYVDRDVRLFRLVMRKTVPSPGAGIGGQPRISSPCPTVSTLMMSAPRSPSIGRIADQPGLSTGRGRGCRSGVLTLLFLDRARRSAAPSARESRTP